MKIKFRALCLAALVVVMAFASVASAATFVGATKAGTVQTFTVDLSDGGTPLSRKSAVSLAPNLMSSADRHNDLKFFGIPGKVFAVSTDTGDGQLGSYLYEFTVNADGNPAYSKTLDATSLVLGLNGRGTGARANAGSTTGGVRRVVDFKGDPVFIGQSAFAVLLNDTNIKSLDVSVDVAFVHNDKLYIINSNVDANTNDTTYIQSVSAITTGTKSTDIADVVIGTRNTGKSELLSYAINGQKKIDWKSGKERGAFSSVVTEKYVYLASEKGVYKIELTETDVLHSPKVEKTVLQGEFLAMTSEGETIYAWKKLGGVYYLVAVSTGSDAETELHRMTNEEWSIPDVAPSFDICYNPSDKVIGVVAHASPMASVSGLAVFIPSTTQTNKWDLYHVDSDFQSAALLASTSTTPDTPDTPATPTTTVDISTLDSTVASTIASTMGTDASKFVTATVASKTSTTSAAEAAVKTAFGDTNAKVTVLGSYTPSAEGFILVAQSIAHGKKAYFVDESILAADSTGLNEATLLDSTGAALTSGNSTYVAGGSLDANKAYTLVTAETASSEKEDDGDTGSSSSGCDAGFGLMSLAALLAVTTISKRR